jgi:hypothetical protein
MSDEQERDSGFGIQGRTTGYRTSDEWRVASDEQKAAYVIGFRL